MDNTKILKMKSVLIEGNERSETELATECRFEIVSGDTCVITYDESDATGFDGSKTKLTFIGENYASIERTGSYNSSLLLEVGKKHYCHYGTPYGSFTVGINAVDMKNSLLHSDKKSAYVKYTVDLNSSYISENEIYFDIS